MLQKITDLISTHTPHAGRDGKIKEKEMEREISTHTPHAGRDQLAGSDHHKKQISTHTPHAGRDSNANDAGIRPANFYSHAPCGARQYIC